MTDLYLVLRRRLEGLPEWVFIEAGILRAARESKGLSYETMARTLPVSAKTWERYEKAGRIPRPQVTRVAEVLELEIEEPARRRVVLDEPRTMADEVNAILQIVDDDLQVKLSEVFDLVQELDRKLDRMRLDERLAALEELIRSSGTRPAVG